MSRFQDLILIWSGNNLKLETEIVFRNHIAMKEENLTFLERNEKCKTRYLNKSNRQRQPTPIYMKLVFTHKAILKGEIEEEWGKEIASSQF